MGTLFEPTERVDHRIEIVDIKRMLLRLKQIAAEEDLELKDLLKLYEIMALERRNNLILSNGNIKDEQLMGFGELLQDIISQLSELNNSNSGRINYDGRKNFE